MNSSRRTRLLLVLIALVSATLVFTTFGEPVGPVLPTIEFSEFAADLERDEVAIVGFTSGSPRIEVTRVNGDEVQTIVPPGYTDDLTEQLLENPEISVGSTTTSPGRNWGILITGVAPLILMVVLIWVVIKRMGGGGKKKKDFTERGRKKSESVEQVTFDDVAGCHEAVIELGEIRDFLLDPSRFTDIGAKIPKGVLLYGPPGTGKTLLARAVAGEAGVPFFSLSGSDFVEVYAGQGASRVRDLFDQARKEAPAIIFVDEIDAVGRHRGGSGVNGNEEREQTLNQLLVEMDGFDVDTGVLFIAATNRPDVLDSALLRPGRFDRQVAVETPDLDGRRQIIAVHAKGKPLGPDADVETIARRTPGFTGADLANLLNEAALLAARRKKTVIGDAEIDNALDRVVAGAEKGANTLSEREKQIIAYHESGHAIVGHVLPNADPIHKVSIIARGKALGFTLAIPEKDKILRSRSELNDEMAMLLGGRIAEEIIFGDPTTGAHDDLRRVTELARSMVTVYGMSSLGLQKFGASVGEQYASSTQKNYSEDLAMKIDDEIASMIANAGVEAREILTLHRPILDRMAEALIEKETLNKAALDEIFAAIGPVDAGTADDAILDLRTTPSKK